MKNPSAGSRLFWCEITLILAQPRFYYPNPSSLRSHYRPSEATGEGNGRWARWQSVNDKAIQHKNSQGYAKLQEFMRNGMPLETLVRRLRSQPSGENVAKVHWLERILEKEIEKESKSLEQLVTGFGRYGTDRIKGLGDWVARAARSDEQKYYQGQDKEPLETPEGRMTELGVAVLNSLLKQFLENAYSLGNNSIDGNTVKVPGYIVLNSDHPSEKPEQKPSCMTTSSANYEHPALLLPPVIAPKRRMYSKPEKDAPQRTPDGKELPFRPWKNLSKTETRIRPKNGKLQIKTSLDDDFRKVNFSIWPRLNFRRKMYQALNSMKLMSELKVAIANHSDSEGGLLHKYRLGVSPPRNRLGRQWERIRRSDNTEKDDEGVKLELKELLNTITNRSNENEKPDEEAKSDDITSLPRVAFALPKNILMDSTTTGSQIGVSRYHCHRFLPSCARFATLHRKHHRNPTSELLNFLLMLHNNGTKLPLKSLAEPEEEYGCYDEEEVYDDEEEEEYDEGDLGNPFQELKIPTTVTCPTLKCLTPATWLQVITCACGARCSTTSSPRCPTASVSTTTCQGPTKKRCDLTLTQDNCKTHYEALLGCKDATDKKDFFGELHFVTPVRSWIEKLAPRKSEDSHGKIRLCICNISGDQTADTTKKTTLATSTATTTTVATTHTTTHTTTQTTTQTTNQTAATNVTGEATVSSNGSCQMTTCPKSTLPPSTCQSHGSTEPLPSCGTVTRKIVTYPCPITPCDAIKTTLPPIPQQHVILSMAPVPPLPTCGVIGAAKNSNMPDVDQAKKRTSRRNRGSGRGHRRHKIVHEPPHRRRYQRRLKPKHHMNADDQTGLLAILADPSMPGAMQNGLWRYIPYRMVHFDDFDKPPETKHVGIHDLNRALIHRESLMRKKPLQRLLLRDEPKYRRRHKEGKSKDDDDYDYDYLYPDELYENSL